MKLSTCRIESTTGRSMCVSVTLKLSVRELSLLVMRTVMGIDCKLRAEQSPSVRPRTGQLHTSTVRHIRWVGASSLDGIGHRLTVRLSFIYYCMVVTEDKEINE